MTAMRLIMRSTATTLSYREHSTAPHGPLRLRDDMACHLEGCAA
jgi:hypothetical protein